MHVSQDWPQILSSMFQDFRPGFYGDQHTSLDLVVGD